MSLARAGAGDAHITNTPRNGTSFSSVLTSISSSRLTVILSVLICLTLDAYLSVLIHRIVETDKVTGRPNLKMGGRDVTLTKVHDVVPANSAIINHDIYHQHLRRSGLYLSTLRGVALPNSPQAQRATAFHYCQPVSHPKRLIDQLTFFTSKRGFLSPDSTTALDVVGGSISISADIADGTMKKMKSVCGR